MIICARMLAARKPPVGIYFISEDLYTLASYYRDDLREPCFFPTPDWEILPDDELDIIIYDTDYDVIADTEENVVPGVDGYTGTVVGTTVYVDASLTGVAQTEAVIATLEAYGFALEANLTVGQTTGIAASKGGINYTFVVDSAVGALTEAYNDADGATVDVYLTAAVEAGELEVVLKDADGNAVAQTSNKVALAAEEWSCYFSAAARTSGTWDAGCQDLGAEVIAAAETAEVYVFGVLAGTYAVEEYVPEV